MKACRKRLKLQYFKVTGIEGLARNDNVQLSLAEYENSIKLPEVEELGKG